MKPEIKEKWLKALRSGEYIQTNGRLIKYIDNDPTGHVGYCCWGVLCDLIKDECPTAKKNLEDGRNMPDKQVHHYCEIATCDYGVPLNVIYNGASRSLWGLNDIQGLTFTEIADIIEAQL